MKHEVNAMGKQCPIPVVMTKKVIDNAAVGDEIDLQIKQAVRLYLKNWETKSIR